MKTVEPQDLRQRIRGQGELAIIDVREEGPFIREHLFYSSNVPLERLRTRIEALVPRHGTPLVLIDDSDDLALARVATATLTQMGYRDVAALRGGMQAAFAAGFERFSGVHVPSKAFGELVEITRETPHVSAEELHAMMAAGSDVLIVDARPLDEFQRMSIPGAINIPGAELVHRIWDVATDPETPIIVNCAGRTRSIIGAQSLINAGIPNPVYALKDGTAGWQLAGLALAHGASALAPPGALGTIDKRQRAAAQVAARFGVQRISLAEYQQWHAERDVRTLYLFDVRSPEEYRRGHMTGARSAPGGQLVQSTDDFAGVLGARIVLTDDDGVRATMTASWLMQLGWQEVAVLVTNSTAAVSERPRAVSDAPIERISAVALHALMGSSMAVAVIDVSDEAAYCAGHIPGAVHSATDHSDQVIAELANIDVIVLTGDDDLTVEKAAGSLAPHTGHSVLRILEAGNSAWRAAGLPMNALPTGVLRAPVLREAADAAQRARIMGELQKYLTWEIGLVAQIEREGDARYRL